ncbi:alpha/beta fold hydrolase [Dactylosporangium fulvum]|uniref:Alpha/beta fold hydrolase n=1 Tax=Dactylosporangium fulvum TaxID=53359 RepID=A0ABY5W784_9ACTN|nr:alpha/beta fold hydrolase [Dactylosporangium fulvum]UWP85392.1 alpha/beta fold hydrolase [Dactylosporangium fulvum]
MTLTEPTHGKATENIMRTTSYTSPWLITPKPDNTARLRLFCIPYAGGGASMYRAWMHRLPGGVEVNAVQLPGREERFREEPMRELDDVVARLGAVLAENTDRPYAILGHSMGSLLAFETARRLRAGGCPAPELLVVSGRGAAQIPPPWSAVHHLPEDEFVQQVMRMHGTPAWVFENQQLREMVIRVLRADLSVVDTYRYHEEAPLSCPITAFTSPNDPLAPPEHVRAWAEQTAADFRYHEVDGGHFFLRDNAERFLSLLSSELTARLPA